MALKTLEQKSKTQKVNTRQMGFGFNDADAISLIMNKANKKDVHLKHKILFIIILALHH